jgi:hypothetical protein
MYLAINVRTERLTWALMDTLPRRPPNVCLRLMLRSLSTVPVDEVVAALHVQDRHFLLTLFTQICSGGGFLNDLRSTPDVTARIGQPALVITSRTDGGVTFTHAESLAAAFPTPNSSKAAPTATSSGSPPTGRHRRANRSLPFAAPPIPARPSPDAQAWPGESTNEPDSLPAAERPPQSSGQSPAAARVPGREQAAPSRFLHPTARCAGRHPMSDSDIRCRPDGCYGESPVAVCDVLVEDIRSSSRPDALSGNGAAESQSGIDRFPTRPVNCRRLDWTPPGVFRWGMRNCHASGRSDLRVGSCLDPSHGNRPEQAGRGFTIDQQPGQRHPTTIGHADTDQDGLGEWRHLTPLVPILGNGEQPALHEASVTNRAVLSPAQPGRRPHDRHQCDAAGGAA